MGLASLAALAAPHGQLRAAANNEQRLIIVVASGGWDPTWVFDPKPDSAQVDTPTGDWQRYGELELWRHQEGSPVDRFFTAWGSRTAVVNGVAVDSLVHEECMRRVLTGASDTTVADVGARIAHASGPGRPLPYMVQGSSARSIGLEAKTGMLGYTQQLSTLTSAAFAYPDRGDTKLPDALSNDERGAIARFLGRRTDQVSARVHGSADAQRLADYRESLDRSLRIRGAALGGFLTDAQLLAAYDPWRSTVAALAQDFCQVAMIEHDGYWDTHFGNEDQGPLFDDLFYQLDRLLRELDGAGQLERSTVLVVSEMGRSPELNGNAGKDHWPFTSALVVGPRVRSRVVRGTDDGLRGRTVDPKTGVAQSGGLRLGTRELLATVTGLLGLDAAKLYPETELLDVLLG